MPHTPAKLACPHCKTPLRLAVRPTDLLSFACPECNGPLELFVRDDEVVVQPAPPQPDLSQPDPSQPARSKIGAASRRRVSTDAVRRRWQATKPAIARRLSDPLTVTWIAAGIAAAALMIAILRERAGRAEPTGPAPTAPVAATPADTDAHGPEPDAEPVASVVAARETAGTVAEASAEATHDASRDSAANAGAVDESPEPQAVVVYRQPVVARRPAGWVEANRLREVEERLAQQIVRFEQPTPIAFDVLRTQIEELAGVSIVYDDSLTPDSPAANAEISISLQDATLAAVLDEVVRQAGLTYTVEPTGIRLLPQTTEPAATDSPDSPATPSDAL